MKKAISVFLIFQLLIVLFYLVSPAAFTNVEVAFLSAFFIIVGSSFAYKKMVLSQVKNKNFIEKRDLLDEIEDPHGLYDEEEVNNAPFEELDLKAIVKEEKAKVKTLNLKNMKHGVKGSISFFRLIPYLFLVLGFIALENNHMLMLPYYLPALFGGIIAGSFVAKEFA